MFEALSCLHGAVQLLEGGSEGASLHGDEWREAEGDAAGFNMLVAGNEGPMEGARLAGGE